MPSQHPTQKTEQSQLCSAPSQKLVIELDEQHQELLSGGAADRFQRSKPHVNVGSYS